MYQEVNVPSEPRSRIGSFRLEASREQAFPLFTARGERDWAPGWDPVMLSGAEERGSAFQTRNHEGETTTWIVVDYRPSEGRASYARLAQGSHIGLVDVICTETQAGVTEVSVRYTLTPLHAGAETLVEEFLDPRRYEQMMEDWRQATAAALARR
jgi:hypothetical protein